MAWWMLGPAKDSHDGANDYLGQFGFIGPRKFTRRLYSPTRSARPGPERGTGCC